MKTEKINYSRVRKISIIYIILKEIRLNKIKILPWLNVSMLYFLLEKHSVWIKVKINQVYTIMQ